MVLITCRLLLESGTFKTFGYGPVRSTGWHSLGTCVMGTDHRRSVVNEFGRTHDISNLYIFDSSIFPTLPASILHLLFKQFLCIFPIVLPMSFCHDYFFSFIAFISLRPPSLNLISVPAISSLITDISHLYVLNRVEFLNSNIMISMSVIESSCLHDSIDSLKVFPFIWL